MPDLSFRLRVTLVLAAFAMGVSLLAVESVDRAGDQIETLLLSQIVEHQFAQVRQGRLLLTPESDLPSELLRVFVAGEGSAPGRPLPAELRVLPPGHHDDIELDGLLYEIEVRPVHGRLVYVAYNIEQLDALEGTLQGQQYLGAVLLVGLALVGGYLLAGLLTAPVRRLALQVQAIDPTLRGAADLPTQRLPELRVIAEAVNGLLRRLDAFVQREQAFSATVSHELRTPVAVVGNAVELLAALPSLPEHAQPPLGRIRRAAQDMQDIIAALLHLARERQAGGEEAETLPLHALLQEAVEDHRHLLAGRAITLHLQPPAPQHLSAPRAAVLIALGNLLRNAIQHTEQGRIEIRLVDGVLRITNTGRLVAPQQAIARFQQRMSAGGPPVARQGLGLYLIGRVCEYYGWHFDIEGSPERGATVTLDFSPSLLEAPAPGTAAAARPEAPHPS